MHHKYFDLLLVVAIAVVNVLWALLPDHLLVIRIIFALPLVFVLPGYTLTEILFHRRSLDGVHRLLLNVGLSLAIDVLAGFILNVFPMGLRELSWAVFLGLLSTVLSLWVAYLRRKQVVSNEASNRFRLRLYELVLLGSALAVVVLSVQYAAINVINEPHPGFTQLWILPLKQQSASCGVRLGIRNFESAPMAFRVVMTTNESQVTIWPSIVLVIRGEWEQAVTIKPDVAGNMYVHVQLYRVAKPEAVYRDVHLTLHSSRGGGNGQGQLCTT